MKTLHTKTCENTANTMYWFLFLGINIRKKSIWRRGWLILSISSVQSRPTLCDPMDCSIPDFPVHQSPDLAQNHVHRVGDAIQPSHPLSSPSSPVLNLSQHQGLFQWVNSLHQVAKYWSFSFSISPSNEESGLISKQQKFKQ